MKSILILAVLIMSFNGFSQTATTKARAKILPASVQGRDTVKPMKKDEVPCADSKEDVLKKLEEKKKAQAEANKGFSLQGNTDTGCTIK